MFVCFSTLVNCPQQLDLLSNFDREFAIEIVRQWSLRKIISKNIEGQGQCSIKVTSILMAMLHFARTIMV